MRQRRQMDLRVCDNRLQCVVFNLNGDRKDVYAVKQFVAIDGGENTVFDSKNTYYENRKGKNSVHAYVHCSSIS